MNEELKMLLFLIVAVLLVAGLMRSAWRMLKQSERMLDKVDKSKLKDLNSDQWDD